MERHNQKHDRSRWKDLVTAFCAEVHKKANFKKVLFKGFKPTTLFGPVGFLSKYGFSSDNTRKRRVFQQVNLFKVFHRYSKLLELYQLPKYTQYCVYMQLVCRLLGVEKALWKCTICVYQINQINQIETNSCKGTIWPMV